MIQGSEEWFAARLGIPTASKFSDIMANGRSGQPSASRKNYLAELVVERLTGQRTEGFTNAAMQWGTETEPFAVEAYEAFTGELTRECGFIKHPTIECGASPDRLVGEEGLLEVKCPNTATHIDHLLNGTLLTKYKWQLQGQLMVTGMDWVDFVVFDPRVPERMQIRVDRVHADAGAIQELTAGIEGFLVELNEMTDQLEKKYAISE